MAIASTSYPRNKIKVLLLENISDAAVKELEAGGYTHIERIGGALGEADLIKAVRGVHLLGIRSKTKVTKNVLEAADKLLAIGAFCIGVNQIDLKAATEKGIAVFNAPHANTRSVAELIIGLSVMLIRKIADKNAAAHRGEWLKEAKGSFELRGKTLGIIGYGNIGSQVSVLAEAFGMHVYYYDIVDKLALGNARGVGSLDELLGIAETVTVHVDGRPGSSGLFGAAQFAKMRPRSLFLNLSRGFVVDDHALRAALDSGHIAGAALDVYPHEPKASGDTFESPLRGVPNVILTPHVGGSTQEAQQDIGRFVAGKLIDYVKTGATSLSVNMPQVQVGASEHKRIVSLHRNVPGVLAKINTMLADLGANIEGQNLATRGNVGYVVLDVNTEAPREVIAALEAMPESIRVVAH